MNLKFEHSLNLYSVALRSKSDDSDLTVVSIANSVKLLLLMGCSLKIAPAGWLVMLGWQVASKQMILATQLEQSSYSIMYIIWASKSRHKTSYLSTILRKGWENLRSNFRHKQTLQPRVQDQSGQASFSCLYVLKQGSAFFQLGWVRKADPTSVPYKPYCM